VALVRVGLQHHGSATPNRKPPAAAKHTHARAVVPPAVKRVYVVRAGDTLVTIAAATGVSVAKLQKLNPAVAPTSLFIGDKIRLR
jgi:LysM repeat protein